AAWGPITIAELLDHTSGIANWSSWRLTGPLPGEAADPAGAIITEAQRVPLAFAPGSRAAYSNPGYVVLGDIIARVSGMSYPAFLQRAIFGPLGMTRTGVYRGGPAQPGHALGYLASGAVAETILTAWSTAAGAIYSTTGDLDRWDQALITGRPRLVPPALLAQVLTVHATSPCRARPLPSPRLPTAGRPGVWLRLVHRRRRRGQAGQPLWLCGRLLGLQRFLPRPRHHRDHLVQPRHHRHQPDLRPAQPPRHHRPLTAMACRRRPVTPWGPGRTRRGWR